MERRDFLKSIAAAGLAASAGSLVAGTLTERIETLWKGTEAAEFEDKVRTDIHDSAEPKRKMHAHGRSQCRTTHKRKDC